MRRNPSRFVKVSRVGSRDVPNLAKNDVVGLHGTASEALVGADSDLAMTPGPLRHGTHFASGHGVASGWTMTPHASFNGAMLAVIAESRAAALSS